MHIKKIGEEILTDITIVAGGELEGKAYSLKDDFYSYENQLNIID